MRLLGYFVEEWAWEKVKEYLESEFVPLLTMLDQEGVLEGYLKLAKGNRSIWQSGIPRGRKKEWTEKLADANWAPLLAKDPGRLVSMAIEAMPDDIKEKVMASAAPDYWVGEVRRIFADAGVKEN